MCDSPRRATWTVCAAACFAALLASCKEEKKPDAHSELERRDASVMKKMDQIAASAARASATWAVIVTAPGERPQEVAAVLGDARAVSREEAVGLLTRMPALVGSGLTMDQAAALRDQLIAAGASARIENSGTPEAPDAPRP